MLSWVPGINRFHHQKVPSWYENEISLNISTAVLDNQQQQQQQLTTNNTNTTPTSVINKKRMGLFPKLRRAIEAATHGSASNHNGSFPVQQDHLLVPPLSPGELTAFEACDSTSQCSQSVLSESCSTQASYDMSKIDEDSFSVGGGAAVADSLCGPSPTASEADSLFGVSIRDMVASMNSTGGGAGGGCSQDRDDVWLLSVEDEIQIDVPPPTATAEEEEDIKSPGAAGILRRVPELVLPSLQGNGQLKQNIMKDSPASCCTDYWNMEAVGDEEEIEFDDGTFLISGTKEQYNNLSEKNGDENRNSNIMTRAQVLGKNLKGMWNSTDCGKHVQNAKRKYRKALKKKSRKEKTTTSPSCGFHSHGADPLQQLSKCHERMLENGHQPFSPKRAFARIRDRIRRDTSKGDSVETQHSVLLSMSSSVSTSSADEPSEVSLPSELFPSISINTTLTHDAEVSVDACPSDKAVDVGITPSLSSENTSLNHPIPVQQERHTNPRKQSQPSKLPPTFKIKFKSPRNDTPRIMMDQDVTSSDSGEEPRILYTDEGYVEAYIHPKGISGSGSMSSRNSLNHVFHSELSTLYEVSSSLESASFASGSAASMSETTSMCATAGHSRAGVPPVQAASSVTTTDTISTNPNNHQPPDDGRADETPGKDTNNNIIHNHHHNSEAEAEAEQAHHNHAQGCFVDDREVKMRWEFSLGLMESQGLWRQPNMPLMNTEEMAHDYVAEI